MESVLRHDLQAFSLNKNLLFNFLIPCVYFTWHYKVDTEFMCHY